MKQNEAPISIGQSIQYFRKLKGINQSDLANGLHVTRQIVSSVENDRGSVHVNRIKDICKLLGIGEFEFWQHVYGTTQNANGLSDNMAVYGYVNDKSAIQWGDNGFPVSDPIGELAGISVPAKLNCYALIVKDNSMDPFERDWKLVVAPAHQIQHRDHVIVEHAGSLLFRRIFFDGVGDSFTLTASKGFIEPLELKRRDVQVLQKVWAFFSPE